MGTALAALASTREHQYLLQDFATLLDVGGDGVWPLQVTILVEPLGGAQIAPIVRVCPSFGYIRIDHDLELRLVFYEEVVFLDGDPRTGPPRRPQPEPDPSATPEPVPVNVRDLGPRLWSVGISTADQDSLEVFANTITSTTPVTAACLLAVLVVPGGGAQIRMVAPARPGTSVKIDDDLQVLVLADPL